MALVGAPMNAAAFAPLADLLAEDHTVLTLDPRGIHRSQIDDRGTDSTVEVRADDLSRLITHAAAGPAAVFGSSGGAVTALALAQAHPDQVTSVIAHEPPMITLLEDADEISARTEDYCTTYLAGDVVAAWTKFFDTANIPVPLEAVQGMFGGTREARIVADEHFWFAHELRPSVHWQPDVSVLHSLAARVLIGIGEESTDQICDRTSRALAEALGIGPTLFPGDHTGFVDHTRVFAQQLRSLLEPSRVATEVTLLEAHRG